MKLFTLALVFFAALSGSAASAAELFLGAYPNAVVVFDEAKQQVLERIPLVTGTPRALHLSADGKRMYVYTIDHSGIETIDVSTRKVISHFELDTPAKRYRFGDGIVADPEGKLLYTVTTEIDKEADRYEIGKPKYTVIDLTQQKIVRVVDISREDEASFRGNARGLDISPDGKYIYQFRDRIIILNTTDFKVVERIELSKPEVPGMEMENVGFGGEVQAIRQPGQRVSLFNSSDRIIHNRLFGIARFDLTTRQMDYVPIGPAPAGMAGLQVTPNQKKAYTVVSTGAQGNKRCEFWSFDLDTDNVTQRAEFPCRARFSFGMSGDGKKLYIYAAGFEIEVYDAITLKYERTWDLNNDMTGPMIVVR
jgi:DNA-binding beta-propeller fold protein YncE